MDGKEIGVFRVILEVCPRLPGHIPYNRSVYLWLGANPPQKV